MKKLLTIAKDSTIKVNSKVTDYLLPDEIYIPIEEKAKMLITKKNINKGDALFSLKNKIYYSPVSGKILNVMNRYNSLYLKIKNDFKENDNYIGTSEFTTITLKTDFPKKIRESSNYDWKKYENKLELILNGIEDEPYVATKPFFHKLYTSEILQMLDLLSETFHIEKISIYVKENDRESIEAFESFIGTYPNICLKILPDVYPIGNDFIFHSYLKLEKTSLVVSTEEIYDIYREVVKERKKDTVLITLTGDAIKNPQVINVKIGTLLEEVVKDLIEFQTKDYITFLNGLMCGTKVSIKEVVLTEDVRVLYFMKNKEKKVFDCSKCGKCIEVCPLKCNPYRSYVTKGLFKNKDCISCGLCTFICPSNISLYEYLGGNCNE